MLKNKYKSIILVLILFLIILFSYNYVYSGNFNKISKPLVANVKDFGATGDGITYDEQAIINAINYVQNKGVVVFPTPEVAYVIDSTITIPDGVRLVALGGRGTWNIDELKSAIIRPTSNVTTAIESNCSGCTIGISNLAIDMTNMPDGSIGFYGNTIWSSKINDLTIYNIDGSNSRGIKLESNETRGGIYTNQLSGINILGKGGGTKPDIGIEMAGLSGKRITSLIASMIQVSNVDIGVSINYGGAGIIFNYIVADTNMTNAMTVTNQAGGLGNNVTVIGGEVNTTGNGFSGDILLINVVQNGVGNLVDSSSNASIIDITNNQTLRISNTGIEAKFFSGNEETRIIGVSDSIVPNISAVRLTSTGGNVTLTSDPQIEDGLDGQPITICGGSNTDYITLVDGQGLRLSGNFDLTFNECIYLMYFSTFNDWMEISRSIN